MKTLFIIFSLLIHASCFGQEVSVGGGYNYLYSQQYDQLIQTYNFSRPHLSEKQPLLTHGIGFNARYLFETEKNMNQGIVLDFAMFSSSAENPNHQVTISLNMLEIGYALNFHNKEKFGNFYGEVGLNAVMGFMNKTVDGEPYMIDDERVQSFQVGTSIHTKLGYTIEINHMMHLSPFIGFRYAPYFSEGQSEVVINQTDGLLADQHNAFFQMDAGVRVHFPL